MNLFVHKVVEFEHVHDAHGDPVLEGNAGAAVIENALAVVGEMGFVHPAPDFILGGAVEDRRPRGDALAQLAHGSGEFLVVHLIHGLADLG